MTTQTITDAQIAEAAFFIWLEEGRPAGRDQAHWFAAAERLKTQSKPTPKKRAAAKPKTAAAKADAPAAKTATKPKGAAPPRAKTANSAEV